MYNATRDIRLHPFARSVCSLLAEISSFLDGESKISASLKIQSFDSPAAGICDVNKGISGDLDTFSLFLGTFLYFCIYKDQEMTSKNTRSPTQWPDVWKSPDQSTSFMPPAPFQASKPLKRPGSTSSLRHSDSSHQLIGKSAKPAVDLAPVAFTMSLSRPNSASSQELFRKYKSVESLSKNSKSALKNHSQSSNNLGSEKKSVSFKTLVNSASQETLRAAPTQVPKKSVKNVTRAPTPGLGSRSMEVSETKVTPPPLDTVEEQTISKESDPILFRESVELKPKEEEKTEYYAVPEKEDEYTLTPYQLDIYNKLHPAKEEVEAKHFHPYRGDPLFVSQAFKFKHQFRVSDFQLVSNKICSLYDVLQSRFFRNDKIIDADVIGLIDKKDWKEMGPNAFVEVIDPDHYVEFSNMNSESLTDFTKKWMHYHFDFKNLFKVLYIPTSKNGTSRKDAPDYLVFVGCTLAVDSTSLSWLAREIINLYCECVEIRMAGLFNSVVMETLDAYRCKEKTSFCRFSDGCVESKFSMSFWRSQCMETVQESIEYLEREDLEGQLRKLEVERYNLKGSLASLNTRKGNLEYDLHRLMDQRKKLDSGQNGEGPMAMYVDPVTKETIVISVIAKAALIRAVLGLDMTNDNVLSFLDKHNVPKDVQRKIGASVMDVEKFSEVTEESIQNLGILKKDRRKLLALVDYVSTRIRESFHEQHKIKSGLERRILKIKRDLERVNEMLAVVKEQIETNDDMYIRLNSILKPPIYEARILSLNLRELQISQRQLPSSDYNARYGFVPFRVEDDVLTQLRNFREGFMLSKKQKAFGGKLSDSDSNGMISSGDSSDQEEDTTDGPKRRVKSVDAVCLAAFSVLLKHISGQDKFLLGLTQSYRSRDVLVGPLTDTVPLKIDMSKKRLEFRSLFSSLYRSLFHARQQGVACPSAKIGSKYKESQDLSVRFEFTPYKDTMGWLKNGMTREDLLCDDFFASEHHGYNIQGERLWSISETDDYDLKLILFECKDSIEAGIRYRKDKFKEEQVMKWVTKFQSTLQSIEYSQRKIHVSTMISRYCVVDWLIV